MEATKRGMVAHHKKPTKRGMEAHQKRHGSPPKEAGIASMARQRTVHLTLVFITPKDLARTTYVRKGWSWA